MTEFTPEYPGDTPNAKYVRDKAQEKGIFEQVEAEALRALVLQGIDSEDTRNYIDTEFQKLMRLRWPKGMWITGFGFNYKGEPVVFWIHA